MSAKVRKTQVGSLAALFYIARKAVGALVEGRQLDPEQLDTIVANKVLTQSEKLSEKGGR